MLDIKQWLLSAGEPVADTGFARGDAPGLPFVVFLDTVTNSGSDNANLLQNHGLTVERYCDTTDDNPALEALLDALAVGYKKEKQWLNDMECYMTTYTFDLYLKK